MTPEKEQPARPAADETELSDSELEQVAAGTSSEARHRITEVTTNAVKNAGKALSH